MKAVRTIGLDIAKSVFQVHGIDAAGKVVIRKQLNRARVLPFFMKLPSCVVGIEACASSHYWARELTALGHEVKLMPPAYVKPYVKRQKNDAADAEAICEAVQRPTMRFVPIKSQEQQTGLVLHRTRHLLIRQLTAVTNSIRAHLTEFGIVAPVGRRGVDALIALIRNDGDDRIPGLMRTCSLSVQAQALREQIRILDRRLVEWHRSNELCKRLDAIPGVGPVSPISLLRWRARRHSVCEETRRQTPALADIAHGPAANKGRGNRARQQACQDGVGNDGQGRELQGTSRTREIA